MFAAVAEDGRGVRNQGQQGTQAAAGASDRVLLEPFADREQERQHRGLANLAEQDGADGGDRHQRPDPDLALGQALERGGDEGVAGDDQRHRFQGQLHRARAVRPPHDQGGDQQHPGEDGGPDLGDLPQLVGFVLLFALRAGFVVAAAAGVAHTVTPAPVSVP